GGALGGEPRHRPGVTLDALAMEGRLDERALTRPELAFARQKALPEDPVRGPEPPTLHEAPRAGRERGLDLPGREEHVDGVPEDAQAPHVPLLRRGPLEERQRPGPQLRKISRGASHSL